MIYLVSNQQQLLNDNIYYSVISIKESLEYISNWEVIQFDTETTGRNPHICKILCMQFGNKKANMQIVVDCTTVDPLLYKELLESKLLIGQNLKFDLQFLYNIGIIPTKVWDTMIIEQLLYLGYTYTPISPEEYKEYEYDFPYLMHLNKKTGNYYIELSFSLKAIAQKRLGINIDKTVRGEIIWRGLDTEVIIYAAGDVTYLEDIKESQEIDCNIKKCKIAASLENNFVPAISYLEFCGIRLDEVKWRKKIQDNEDKLNISLNLLNDWLVEKSNNIPELRKFITVNLQGSLWDGFDLKPKISLNWDSSKQVIELVKLIGFDVNIEDKKTGKNKESVVEKHLAKQKGVDDDFLERYFNYKEASKECSTYGMNYINSINPKTGRIHTTFKQLGASSGRMSCGGNQTDDDLAKYKGLSPSQCKHLQLQNLPADEITRSSFIPNEGNLMVSADYSALESRLGADIYNEEAMIKEFLEGSGDIHSLVAKACFANELEGIDVKDVKRLRPDLRKKAKAPEFACQFGGGAKAISQSLGISHKEAKEIENGYYNLFTGIAKFKEIGSKFVRSKGYIVICKHTGHKIYWGDFAKWKKYDSLPEDIFKCELTSDEQKEHNMAAAKWDRMALNSPTQGTGAAIIKYATILLFNWIINNNLFGKVLICNLVHDEMVVEFPKEMQDIIPNIVVKCMEKAASVLCKQLPIPADPAIGDHWIH